MKESEQPNCSTLERTNNTHIPLAQNLDVVARPFRHEEKKQRHPRRPSVDQISTGTCRKAWCLGRHFNVNKVSNVAWFCFVDCGGEKNPTWAWVRWFVDPYDKRALQASELGERERWSGPVRGQGH